MIRVLSYHEVNAVSGAGPIADGATAIGGFIGAKVGSSDGGAIGAEIGAIVCSPGAAESAGVAPAICAAIGYSIGSKYGEVTGLAGGSALGGMIGKAIEGFIDNPAESIGDAIHSIFGDYNPSDASPFSDANLDNASFGDFSSGYGDGFSDWGGGGDFGGWGSGGGGREFEEFSDVEMV